MYLHLLSVVGLLNIIELIRTGGCINADTQCNLTQKLKVIVLKHLITPKQEDKVTQ